MIDFKNGEKTIMIQSGMNNRDENIDVLKATCLIGMILGHCGFPATKFIYLFHMPLFFMTSGYLFNRSKVNTLDGLKNFIIRKIKSLWLPYVIWNGLMLVLQNFFLNLNFYTNNPAVLQFSGSATVEYITVKEFIIRFLKILLLKNGTLFTSAFWFIRILFVVEVVVALTWYVMQKARVRENISNIIFFGLAIMAVNIGFLLKIMNINLMDFSQIFVAFFLFWLGSMLNNDVIRNICKRKVPIVISFLSLLLLNTQGIILINQNQFTNPLFLMLCSVNGWILVYGLSNIILDRCRAVGKFAYNLNRAAIDILALHFVAFRLISIIQVRKWNLPEYHLARFPVLDGSSGWWILYFIIGIGVPYVFYNLRMILKKRLDKHRCRYD